MSKPSEIWREVKPKIGEMLREINDMESKYEKAQKEAYQRGYETAKHECMDYPKQAYTDTLRMDVYQKGLSDAWEAARKLYLPIEYGGIPVNVLHQMFDNKSIKGIFMKVSVSEVIEKIRQYKQEKEEQIQVGDEVISEDDIKAVVIDMDDYLLHVLDKNGVVQGWPREDVVKTDRHFPEIAEVLQKMREGQEEKDGVWIVSEANEPSVDTTLICAKCGYAIKIKPNETPALNFCPKCGDCKKPKKEES